jgi:hypothetical protein
LSTVHHNNIYIINLTLLVYFSWYSFFFSFFFYKYTIGEGAEQASKLTGMAPDEKQLKDILAIVHWAARTSIPEEMEEVEEEDKEEEVAPAPAPAPASVTPPIQPHHHKHDVSTDKCNHVTKVQAYHFGSNLIVEVEIIMPNLSTMEVASACKKLRELIEEEEDVERCFVTLHNVVADTSLVAVEMNHTTVVDGDGDNEVEEEGHGHGHGHGEKEEKEEKEG